MKIAWAMMTAPRPVPTVNASLASFRAAGFTDRVSVFSDAVPKGTAPAIDDQNVEVTVATKRLGNLHAWDAVASNMRRNHVGFAAQESGSTVDAVAIMQDDIAWSAGAAAVLHAELAAMGDELTGRAGYFSLYPFERHVEESRAGDGKLLRWRNWHATRLGRKAVGAQCLILPADAVKKLLGFRLYYEHLVRNARGDDQVVSECLDALGLSLWVRLPGLVSHAPGIKNSALGHKCPPDALWEEEARHYEHPPT